MEPFTKAIVTLMKCIPKGSVSTYGQLARMAGHPKGARQVSRILHSMSRKHKLPWHRVINARGFISLPKLNGYEEQKQRLQLEGICFGENDHISLKKFLWKGNE